MEEFNNHHISSNLQSLFNHAHFLVLVINEKEFIQKRKKENSLLLEIAKKKKNLSMNFETG